MGVSVLWGNRIIKNKARPPLEHGGYQNGKIVGSGAPASAPDSFGF